MGCGSCERNSRRKLGGSSRRLEELGVLGALAVIGVGGGVSCGGVVACVHEQGGGPGWCRGTGGRAGQRCDGRGRGHGVWSGWGVGRGG